MTFILQTLYYFLNFKKRRRVDLWCLFFLLWGHQTIRLGPSLMTFKNPSVSNQNIKELIN